MAVIDEAVRGSLPGSAFYALPGIDRARLYNRDQAPRSPVHHLTGIRITQVVSGSAVVTVPASPWLAHPNGDYNVTFPAEAALEIAALTVAPPATRMVLRTFQYAQLRPCSPESGVFMGRATVIHTTRSLAFAEARVEDGEGRLIAHATGHVAMVPIEPAPAPGPVTPADHPSYPTADPHRRPIDPAVVALFDHFASHGWQQAGPLMVAGELPTAPLHELLGVYDMEIEPGRVAQTMPASPWFQGIDPHVVPGLLTTVALDVFGGASLTHLEPGLDLAILSASGRFTRPVPADGRGLAFTAGATMEDDGALALECHIEDRDGTVAHLTGVALPVPIKGQARRAAPESILTTVLFTDIVGSTSAAERVGDAQWAQVLDAHRSIVRGELERFGGREVNTTGDGFLATFDSPRRAVECARSIRDGVRRVGVEIRAGVHTGECEVMGRDISGTAVNLASRIESCTRPGEVWFSGTVRDLLVGSGLTVQDEGPHELKGIPGEVWLFSLKDAD
ncbi:MAG TPA: adenylate/guanylate cyclase domain-containing protein [Acidimicrobiia bacterium]|nr:adenylate/guanylate cyclase domain-containing protein [Acidimicrobiia bacterium]